MITVKREGGKDIEYIPVELIRPSGDGQREAVRSNQPPDAPLKEELNPKPAPIVDEVSGLVSKVPETSPDAPSPVQAASGAYGNAPGPSQEGTGYQPFHAVSRIPYFRTQVKPVYPPSERAAGVEARVIVAVFISSQGTVDRVEVVKSGGRRFDEAVIAAVKDSSFEPGYQEGRPMPVQMQIPYTFRLR